MKQQTLTACIYLYYDEDDHIITALSYDNEPHCGSICGYKDPCQGFITSLIWELLIKVKSCIFSYFNKRKFL